MIGVVYDVEHRFLSALCEAISETGHEIKKIHWSELSFSTVDSSVLETCNVAYLDRLGEQNRSYATQFELLSKSRIQKLFKRNNTLRDAAS